MQPINRIFPTDGEADTVKGERKALADVRKLFMRPPAIAYIVLGMNLKERQRRPILHDRAEMLGLKADADTLRQAQCCFHPLRSMASRVMPSSPFSIWLRLAVSRAPSRVSGHQVGDRR